ncbi:MAG TPA: SEC-C metal-binding domain-containing protein [Phycisphaerae bacterium]|nr:SEC-C metal-binding domain-containing protein [Phycisphaerae bacterium]
MGLLARLFRRKPPQAAAQLGRNDPCSCGSGRKYKRCHYEADQKYFSRSLRSACNAPTRSLPKR